MHTEKLVSEPKEPEDSEADVLRYFVQIGKGMQSFHFIWKQIGEKRRLIGRPNKPMVELHELFGKYLRGKIAQMGKEGKNLISLPSSTGCVLGSNPLKNAEKHAHGKFFYVTDFTHAYPSLDLKRLSLLLVYILKYDYYRADYSLKSLARNELAHFTLQGDQLYEPMLSFVKFTFGGIRGVGLAVGGNLSPYLLNMYCEVYLDSHLRQIFKHRDVKHAPERTITYTRYVDDLVFSRGVLVSEQVRKEIRTLIINAGFMVNHRKSKVLMREMGTVFVTKVGLGESVKETTSTCDDTKIIPTTPATLVFPQKKRRKLHGIIGSYLATPFQNDAPEEVRGVIAEFLHYYKHVVTPTETDVKTFGLCKKFQEVSDEYRKRYRDKRPTA